MNDGLIVFVTAGTSEDAARIAETLVDERLAACVNIVGPIRSIYRWQGEICRDDERLLVIKTTRERYAALEGRVREIHPYEVPEVIALPIERGSAPYLDWLSAAVDRKPRP
jgi:periplasmic divalent cation tolerance protein